MIVSSMTAPFYDSSVELSDSLALNGEREGPKRYLVLRFELKTSGGKEAMGVSGIGFRIAATMLPEP
jgi:hypothetical protein